MSLVPISNPPNPWASAEVDYLGEPPLTRLLVYEDATREIVSRNDSPDVGFEFSVNPYRGCGHGCAYCYARPYHEYLSLGAGTDFETRIAVKPRAAELLRAHFERPSWKGEPLSFSSATDCYQPLEASLQLTRACLEVCAEYRQPVSIITKSALVERDLDVLAELSRTAAVHVCLSIPFFDPEHARALEPWAPTPARRFKVLERLSEAGIPCGVSVAPIVPGLGDEDIAHVVAFAAAAGASYASCQLLRLPGSVEQVFVERLEAKLPLQAERVLHRIRETRGGRLDDSRFGIRWRGEGEYARQIHALFALSARRAGLCVGWRAEAPATFRRPQRRAPQQDLFGQ